MSYEGRAVGLRVPTLGHSGHSDVPGTARRRADKGRWTVADPEEGPLTLGPVPG